jgi:hypothetical protein
MTSAFKAFPESTEGLWGLWGVAEGTLRPGGRGASNSTAKYNQSTIDNQLTCPDTVNHETHGTVDPR